MLDGGNGNDDIVAIEGGNNTLIGGAGNDFIQAYSTTHEINVVSGGSGTDTIYFGGRFHGNTTTFGTTYIDDSSGNDYYQAHNHVNSQYGIGSTFITDESGSSDNLELRLMQSTDWTITKSANDLVLNYKTLPGQITIENHFTLHHQIENLIFDDVIISTVEILTPNNDIYVADSTTSPFGFDANIVDGLAGDDVIYTGVGDDLIYGRAGNDTLYGQDGDDILSGEDGDDDLRGGNGNDFLRGDSGVDILRGESGDDILYGGADNDILKGGADNDELRGENGDDNLQGEDGNDTLLGGIGNDQLRGHNGNDILRGEDGTDYLYGGNNNDTLYGGKALDVLYGQGGEDTFVLEASTAFDGTFDVLKDYSLTDDALDISDIINFDPLTDMLADFVDVRTSGAHTYIAVDQDGAGGYTDVARIDGAASTIDDLGDFTLGDNLIVA